MKVYIDTSVFGGYFDIDFEVDTRSLFNEFKKRIKIPAISEIVVAEIEIAPENVKNLYNDYTKYYEMLEINKEIINLANNYIAEKAFTRKSINDALHIAVATYHKIDVLTSWNFKHFVNLNRIRLINAANLKFGYSTLEIRTPKEVLEL